MIYLLGSNGSVLPNSQSFLSWSHLSIRRLLTGISRYEWSTRAASWWILPLTSQIWFDATTLLTEILFIDKSVFLRWRHYLLALNGHVFICMSASVLLPKTTSTDRSIILRAAFGVPAPHLFSSDWFLTRDSRSNKCQKIQMFTQKTNL